MPGPRRSFYTSRTKTAGVFVGSALLLVSTVVGAQQPEPAVLAETAVPRISQAEFREHHADGAVLAIDVRDRVAFESGRIAGALHVPIAALAERAADIQRRAGGRLIVTYCACAAESSSAEAARILLEHSASRVAALTGGYVAWVRAGGATEAGRVVVPRQADTPSPDRLIGRQ
jgi:rhodanese-related sulfurtransferase